MSRYCFGRRVVRAWKCNLYSTVLLFVCATTLVGCASGTAPRSSTEQLGFDSNYRYEVLWMHMREFSITFAAEVETCANRIRESSDDPLVHRRSLLWKARSIPEMRKACFRPDPLSALFDAWILSRQMQEFFAKGAGADAFGPFQPEVVAVCEGLVTQILEIRDALKTHDDAMAVTESDLIEPWIAAHPIADFSFNRQSTIAPFAELAPKSGGTFQTVSNINQQITVLTNQIRLALADMPKHVQWEADLIAQELAGPEEIDKLMADFSRITDSVDRAVGVAEQVPVLVHEECKVIFQELDRQLALIIEVLASEREAVLDAISKERMEVLLAVDLERETVLNRITEERAKVIENVDAQRLATLAWAEGERGIVLDTLGKEIDGAIGELRAERALILDEVRAITDNTVRQADGELEELLDLALIRIVLLIALGIIAAPFVAHVYVRVWPTRQT